jgi:lipoyl(octanoyl) transferase
LQHSNLKSEIPLVHTLGCVSYPESREYIRNEVHPHIKGTTQISIFFAEHPPTCTLGKRMSAGDIPLPMREICKTRAIEIVQTDRGGLMTYHGPGQLMIYPVLDLKAFGLTVRSFVHAVLSSVSEVCAAHGIPAVVDDQLQGVWVPCAGRSCAKKIASAGFRILKGISDHGVAIYISEINDEFSYFSPCGRSPRELTSFAAELGESFNSATMHTSFQSLFPEYFLSRLHDQPKPDRV